MDGNGIGKSAPDFGALVGWSHQDLGDRVMVRLQSARTAAQGPGAPIDEFRYFMTKSQAAVLANYLFGISERLPQAKRRRWRWFG
jgi:hypothetical protein